MANPFRPQEQVYFYFLRRQPAMRLCRKWPCGLAANWHAALLFRRNSIGRSGLRFRGARLRCRTFRKTSKLAVFAQKAIVHA